MSTDCMQVMWHPHANAYQVFGLYEDRTVFRWNPTLSHDGNFFATGDSLGRVKLYSTADLELVHQLRSQDVVHDLTFSPDANRFYDVCGADANVWEPSALTWLTELTDQGSDSVSETETDSSTVATKSSIPEVVTQRLDPITAVAGQPHGRLYCCGTEDGTTQLFDVYHGKVALIEQPVGYFTTEKIVWSPDGEYLCYSSINMMTIKKVVVPHDAEEPDMLIESIGGFKPIALGGTVTDMLFNPHSTHLLICTTTGITTVSPGEKEISVSRKLDEKTRKWMNRPSEPTRLLAVSHDTIDVLDWTTLATYQVFNFSQSQSPMFDIPGEWPSSPSAGISSSNRWTSSEKTGVRVLGLGLRAGK
ncbi:WD40-repeat-containing domain protein [Aspergillus granulosus]|uniref:WD40-repeat-containing domain protein n=1 Tax=Aspergillus granulosus TaxID=176169 RepID=A0ABR4I2C9_9EURO